MFHESLDVDYIHRINQCESKFDIIIIDGAVRFPCVQEALKNITARGLIILDNTEWYPKAAKLLTSEGYTQIDFIGFPPINAFPSTTSIFCKTSELLDSKLEQYHWAPKAGRYLDAYDNKVIENISEQFLKK